MKKQFGEFCNDHRCYWINVRDKASTLLGTPATSAVIAHQDQKLADYIDDYYYQILYPPVLGR
jgi:hypothetical protein